MSFKVEVVPSPKLVLGEGPHWDETHQSLFYNDIYGNEASILRYDFNENKVYSATIDMEPNVSFIIPHANSTLDEYAIGIGRRVGIVHWDGKSSKAILGQIAFTLNEDENNRINDAKADPLGRLYCGTMRYEALGDLFDVAAGSFYKYIRGHGEYKLLESIFVSNGMAWNEAENQFYYIDSGKFDVRQYDYDPITGDISNERVAIDFKINGKKPPNFLPDGMTIDTDGNLYIACFGGSKVLKVDPKQGKILLEIPIPAKQVTSVSIGGPNLDILFVTTASMPVSADAIGLHPNDKHNELAGCLFKVTGLGVKGFPGVRVHV